MRNNGNPYWDHHSYIQADHIRGDVIEYASEGNSPEEIAHELGVSVASVRRVLEEACQNEPS